MKNRKYWLICYEKKKVAEWLANLADKLKRTSMVVLNFGQIGVVYELLLELFNGTAN